MPDTTALEPIAEVGSTDDTVGFWSRFGGGAWGLTRAAGRGLAAAFYAVDSDVRRDIAQAPILAVTLLAPGFRAPVAMADDGRRPVVFVHGLGGHRGNFVGLHTSLRLRGHRRCYAVGFPDGGSLDALGRQLAAFVRRVIEVNSLDDHQQVDMVCHSMGGLIARVALEDLTLARRVHTVVTLGTPHHGTHAARFAATHKILDLRPNSELLTRLAHQEPWSAGPRLVCLWSPADPLMQPADTACVAGAENLEIEGLSHIDWMLKPRAWREVAKVLAADMRPVAA